jgi:hypothetical protein
MRFDVTGARAAGYSAEEIAGFLAQRAGLDLGRAREAGYTDEEIIEQLGAREGAAAAPAPAAPAGERSWADTGREMARGLGVGVRSAAHMAGALPGAIYDIASLPVRGAAALVGAPQPRSAQQLIDSAADAVGLPAPANAGERIVQRVGTETGAMLGGMGAARRLQQAAQALPVADRFRRGTDVVARALTSHPGSQTAGAVGAGLGGGLANEVAPDMPLLDLGASVVGGLTGAAAVPIIAGTARGLGAVGRMFTPQGVDDAAAAAMLRATDDPANLAERLRRDRRGLPESLPTSGERAGDAGLLQLERTLRNQPETMPRFAERDLGRDVVRREAIEGLEPRVVGEGTGAEDVQRAVLAARDQTVQQAAERQGASDALWAGAVRSADRRAERAGRALPPARLAEDAGAVIQDTAAVRHEDAWNRTRKLFSKVDPDGTSRIPIQPILAAADDALARMFRPLGAKPPAPLLEAMEELRGWLAQRPGDPTAPFDNLQALRSRLVDMQDQFGSGSRKNSRALAVVNEMKRAVDEQTRRAAEPYELPSVPRSSADMDSVETVEAMAQHPDVAAALARTMDGPGLDERQGGMLSLVQWVRRMGGLSNRSARGDVRAAMGGTGRTMPGLWNDRTGLSVDRAVEKAIEDGYLVGEIGDPDLARRFMAAIEDELQGGERLYPGGFDAARVARAGRLGAADDLSEEVSRRGGSMVAGNPDATMRSMRQAAPEEAYGRPAGDPPPAMEGVVDPVAEGTAFTAGHAQRYRGAINARAEQGSNFERGAMGRVTARGEGGARMDASRAASQFLHGGDGAAGDVQQFIRALGDRGAAWRALEGYAVQSLRDYAFRPDGIDPGRVRAWLGRHGAALRQMPELAEKFGSVEAASRTAQVAKRRAGEAGKAAQREAEQTLRDFESGAARYWLRDKDPEVAVANALTSGNAGQSMRELVRMMRGDQPALRGLRRAYAEEWLRQVSDTAAKHADLFPRLQANQSRKFTEGTKRATAVLFPEAQRETVERIAEDFASGSMVNSVGRAIGSNTAQNLAGARGLSTAYVLGRATSGLLHGEAGSLPATILRPLQYLLRAPEEQVRMALGELMLDPEKAARLVERVSAKNLEMVRRYAERSVKNRFAEAATDAAVRGGARAMGSVQGGEAQREARRGAARYASGGVVEDGSEVRLGRAMAPVSGLGPGEGREFRQHMLPVEGRATYPRAAFREGYTDDEAAQVEAAGVLPAGVGQRRPRAMGGRDFEGQQTPEARQAWSDLGQAAFETVVPTTPLDAGIAVATLPLGGPLGRAAISGLGRVGMGSLAARAGLSGGLMAADGGEAEGANVLRGILGSRALSAYHGSPHVFDRFDISRLGSGEGAQAFGRGHYLAENERIAEDRYRWGLLARDGIDQRSPPYRLEWDDPATERFIERLPADERHRVRYAFGDVDEAGGSMPDWFSPDDPGQPSWMRDLQGLLTVRNYHEPESLEAARHVLGGYTEMAADELAGRGYAGAHLLTDNPHRVVPALGATYEARIAGDPGQFLSLDAPLRWQPEQVRRSLRRGDWPDQMDEAWRNWDWLSDQQARILGLERAWARSGQPGSFSDELNRRGIVGSRFRDGNTRNSTGADSHNLVVFGDDPISITRRYQRGGLAGA